MSGRRARHLRRVAAQVTVGEPQDATDAVYRHLKRVWVETPRWRRPGGARRRG